MFQNDHRYLCVMANINFVSPEKEKCILHKHSIKIDKSEKLVELQNYESWLTLLEAAKVRNYAPVLELCTTLSGNEFPNIAYHRKCRSLFTMKKDLDSLKRKAIVIENEECSSSKRPKRNDAASHTLFEKECLFCGKPKLLKGTCSRERLIQATQLRVDETLRKCANARGDTKLIALTCRDIVAAEAHYHKSCYRDYTRPAYAYASKQIDAPEENLQHYSKIECDSYDDLITFIRSSIIPNKQIVTLVTLTDKLQSIMISKGIAELKDSTRKHVKRNLLKHLGSSLKIYSDNTGKLLVVPNSVTLETVVKENHSLKDELKRWRSRSNIDNIIDLASSHLRKKIKEDDVESPWPCHPSDVDPQSFHVPDYLQRFFVGLLTGDASKENHSQRVNRLTQSFSQDLIYAVTCGHQKPPKHVLITYAVKTLTGNIEIIKALNRLGHGISYSLEENDTALFPATSIRMFSQTLLGIT